MKMFRALLLIVGAVLLGSSVAAAPASADPDHWYDPLPDVGKHSWCYPGSFPFTAKVTNSMDKIESQTIVKTKYHATCQGSTDVRFRKPNDPLLPRGFGPGEFAYTTCYDYKANMTPDRCDTWDVWLNFDIFGSAEFPGKQRRQTICHELGHTLSVRHDYRGGGSYSPTYYSCMLSGEVTSVSTSVPSNWYKVYRSHHIAHINMWFNQ